jgi:TatD DNase family protein
LKPPFINIHSHRKPSHDNEICVRNAYLHEVSKKSTPYYFSTGLHPWHATKYDRQTIIQKLETNCSNKLCLAIGEIGLDKNYPNLPAQLDAFKIQVEYAEAAKLPIIIHEVKSLQSIQEILKNFCEPIIMHGYTKHIEAWEQLNVNNNTYISLGKQSLRPSKKLIETIEKIPLNRMFLETDQLAISIEQIYQQIAIIRSEPIAQLQSQIWQNFKVVFKGTEDN